MEFKSIPKGDESKSLASADTGPRSLSPRESHVYSRVVDLFDLIHTPSQINKIQFKSIPKDDDSESLASTDTDPRSLSPTVSLCGSDDDSEPISLDAKERPSKFAMNLVKAYRNHLSSALVETEDDENGSCERLSVSMKYTDSRFRLSGYYFGHICADNKLPTGRGVLCCYDGTIVEGNWGPHGSPPIAKRLNLSGSSTTCDTSTCSSLSASVTCHFLPLICKHKKHRVPSYIYIPPLRRSVRWADMMEP
jgi:hypothetical protein